jgi:hypothetical protein
MGFLLADGCEVRRQVLGIGRLDAECGRSESLIGALSWPVFSRTHGARPSGQYLHKGVRERVIFASARVRA